MKMKNISIDDDAWRELYRIKLEENFKTLSITLGYVLSKYKEMKGGDTEWDSSLNLEDKR
jgi:hypothetical protein